MPFKSRPEDFGQRILGQLECRYMTAEEFDALTNNPKPLAETFGPDEELLYIGIDTPDGKLGKRTFLRAEYSPVAKWVRWITSWRNAGLEFNADDPASHDGQWVWLEIKSVDMGKYGSRDVWLFGGVPTPEEVARARGDAPVAPVTRPAAMAPKPAPAAPPAAHTEPNPIDAAVTVVTIGMGWSEALAAVQRFTGDPPPTPADVMAALKRTGLTVLAGRIAPL